ncbi:MULTISPECIES: DUF4129 domain-containing protein [unclassified Kaistella]|uniref:DUF4129 domain-containing protein n=1 Tax=unclassified Kaistella TaxID=2762626 RepID=UPI002733F531|nr:MULTISPECIES: DUF4129 domain-containing protein [unclassified Kaistella]MDP2454400.1 DUF4129 domain-containing protein [Kaistella sp. SH11-4b]MDP2457887.1 DUF4129 domain-containing protein [Kaistella sp. SH40-3]MDP2460793.1 DUF4129 domain-containing protein [Kaistella sp. SH19-2b]
MKFRIFFFFFLLQFIGGNSQELPPPSISSFKDSIQIRKNEQFYTDSLLLKNPTTDNIVFPKSFEEKFQSKYKGADYDYTTIKPRESIWQKIQKRIKKILESIFGKVDPNKTASYAENIMRIFAVIIIGFVLYFLIKFLLGKDGNFFFSKKNNKINIENQDLQENIHEINFNESIEKFERQKDYRSAVRYQFLLVLKKLADKKLINWNPEKTNKDYLSELKTDHLKSNFKELAYIFDYVWYGEFEVNEENYTQFKQKFLNFKI